MTAARLIVWRHGRTEWNRTARFQGHADIGLDASGAEQAQRAAAVLATLEPTALFASDLTRAYESASALAAITGLEIVTDQRLREIDVGSWQGLTRAQVQEADPEHFGRLHAGGEVRYSATGETVSAAAERVAGALDELAAGAVDGSTIVICTHGLAGRVGVGCLVGLPPDCWRLLGSLQNCAWSRIERHPTGGFWRIAAHNVTVELTG